MYARRAALTALLLLAQAAGARAQALPAATAPDPQAALREEFRAALDAAAQPPARRAPDSDALRAYLLFPYVEAARLRAALSKVPASAREPALEDRIEQFLARNGEEPVTRDLRNAWLAYLGERKAWPRFLAAAPEGLTETSLRCHALAARLADPPPPGLREEALALWATHKERPAACEPVFQWLDSPQRLSAAEIVERGLFAARHRYKLPASLASLPPDRRALVEFWDRLWANPARELKEFVARPAAERPPRVGDVELGAALVAAFERVARRNSRDARELYAGLLKLPFLADGQRNDLRLAHALGLAYDFDADAIELFNAVPEDKLDAVAREWRVRAALLHQHWKLALKWIDAMPKVQAQEPRWRYFRARLIQRNHPQKSREILAEVARQREFYGFLAAERLGRRPELRPQPVVDDAKVQAELAALPQLQRARELLRCDLPALATAELRHALRDRAAGARAQAARLVTGWGWHVPAVQLLSELQLWDDLWLRYPRPFDPEVDLAARDTGLSPDWIYSVMRTESLYDPRAVSRASALGLLQLLLPTAKAVAQRSGLPAPTRDDLFRPEVNVAIGARYLKELHGGFNGRFILTLAAYNAGPNRVPGWLPKQATDADIWIENIPFNETRAYVQRTLANVVIQGWRSRGEPAAMLPMLAPLQPVAVAQGKP